MKYRGRTERLFRIVLAGWVCAAIPAAWAGSHTWVINEVFSNTDGTIQFVEMWSCCGANEKFIGAKKVTSSATGSEFTFPTNLTQSTLQKHLLLATSGFEALPGAPTPDHILGDNFFSIHGDIIQWHIYPGSVLSFADGELPVDGVQSLAQDGTTGVNSPTNFAGVTGSVVVSALPAPPAVPDGSNRSLPMTVDKLDAAGTDLSIAWDTASCADGAAHYLIHGQGLQLPAVPGGIYSLSGSVCDVGDSSPIVWSATPSASDGSELIWWLLVVGDGAAVEGSWGLDGGDVERRGPGPNGVSAQCGATDRNLENTCGR